MSYGGESVRVATWPLLPLALSLALVVVAIRRLRPPAPWAALANDPPPLPPQPAYRGGPPAPYGTIAPPRSMRPLLAALAAAAGTGAFVLASLFVLPIAVGASLRPLQGLMGVIGGLWLAHALALAVLGYRLIRASEPSPTRRFGVRVVAGASLVLSLGFVFGVMVRQADLYELVPDRAPRVHRGQDASFTPELLGWTSSGFLGLGRSYGKVDAKGWARSTTYVHGDARGTKPMVLRATSPFFELRRELTLEVGEPGVPAFPLDYGSDWLLESSDGPLRWVVVGAGVHQGLESRVIDVHHMMGNRSWHEPPRYVYLWEGRWFDADDDWRLSRPFLEGAPAGSCTFGVLPGYTCTCGEKGENYTFPSVTRCQSGDLAGAAEKVIVGVFTLGFGSSTHYRTYTLTRATHL